MLGVLRHRTYRHLFAAQVISLLGSGLATVALGLLAYDIAGEDGGAVLGTAMAIKMVAYIGIAPEANLISVKVADDDGNATVLDVIRGLQFVVDHKDDYNIRVINLSLESSEPGSYKTDPLDAAVEAQPFVTRISASKALRDWAEREAANAGESRVTLERVLTCVGPRAAGVTRG